MRSRMPFGARAVFTAVLALLTFAPAAMAVDEVNTKKLRQERHRQRDPGARACAPADREQERRHPRVGHAGLRRFGRLRHGPPEEGRLQGLRADVRLPVLPGARPGASCRRSRRPRRTTRPATYDYSGQRRRDRASSCRSTSCSRRPRSRARRSGCEAGDFTAAGGDPAVALIQRGGCDFVVKAENAAGRRLRRRDHLQRGPARPHGRCSPARSAGPTSRSRSSARASPTARRSTTRTQAGPVTVHVVTVDGVGDPSDHERHRGLQEGRRRSKTLVVGAHLDSVLAGPGINDNGSGTVDDPRDRRGALRVRHQAASEAAVRVLGRRGVESPRLRALRRHARATTRSASCSPTSTSTCSAPRTTSASSMTATARTRRTPAPVLPAPRRSRTIFNRYFASQGLASEPTAFDGRSDYGPFIEAGVPGRRPVQRRRGREDGRAGRGLRRHRQVRRTTRATTRPATPSTT